MNKIKELTNQNLKDYCTFKIGGKIKKVYVAKSQNQLVEACTLCHNNKLPYKIIGLGANLLFADKFFAGAIIVNRSKHITKKDDGLLVDSGVTISELINFCLKNNLGGIGSLFGIPSTVGGAVVNSLGAFGCNFSDFVEYVVGISPSSLQKKVKILNKNCGFTYRDSIFKHTEFVITSVKLKLPTEQPATLKQSMFDAIKKKTATQPLEKPNAGSVFKRKGELIPAKIIDELNLKGTQFGNAQISTKHAGFIVNLGNARCVDVLKLIKLTKRKVYHATHQKLTCEIELVCGTKNFYK